MREITFRQGDEKVKCTVSSISTGDSFLGLIDSSLVVSDGSYIVSPDYDKIDELCDVIEDNLPNNSDWDNGYKYSFEFNE